ncbi:Hsp20/alpha crystallin family protein [Sulfurirhabdus autotrophica]|uniref:Heat shock protein Hsp20 n=1 Tax=Sulfurirhabdus autotrophica TaxID=1706046 RepID=A0A4V2W1S1_9PROT|nr:Hsp20/alpha crystallin family protein [Sulfurirhabdus autotrophica]TCV85189.1 heat shock protein Hsp20 [Sulfurirhabdus autotrophica]
MSNLVRRDPFALDDVFDDLFKGFFVRPVHFEGQQQVQIKTDVKEDDKSYTIHAEIPGVKKEDIQISIDGNQVSISAEVKKETEEKEGEKLLRSERYFGQAYRSYTLGQDIDDSAAQAKYTDGILELTLPKKAASSAKKLTVQ